MSLSRTGGLLHRLNLVFWKLKTFAHKKVIAWQDRAGLYSYLTWINENEAKGAKGKGNLPLPRTENGGGQDESLPVSFFLLPGKADPSSLECTLRSCQAQIYPGWELCIFVSGEEQRRSAESVRDRAGRSAQVRVILYKEIGAAIWEARGAIVLALREGDEISPSLAQEAVEIFLTHPEWGIVYFDEDILKNGGGSVSRREPFFKPDWSPELLLSTNYLLHAAIRRDLLLACCEDATSYSDLVLRCAGKPRKVGHLPKVLIHHHRGDVHSRGVDLAEHCHDVEAHLGRYDIHGAQARLTSGGVVQVAWPVQGRRVSVIILSRDKVEYLKKCLSSLFEETRYPDFEVIIVDNSSREPETLAYYRQLRGLPRVTLLENDQPFNYSSFNNFGARHAGGELLLFLNNDIEIIEPGWMEEMARWAELPEVGIVGAKLLFPNGSIQHAGIVIGMEGHASHVFYGMHEGAVGPFGSVEWYRDYSAVTGACMMVRQDVFEEIGGFKEAYRLVFNDVEICQRAISHGYRVMYTPFARLIHYEGKTRARTIPCPDILLGYQDLREMVDRGDPYYNPNLSYSVRVPTFRRLSDDDPLTRLEKIVSQC